VAWIPIVAWGAALLIAAVLLGFCAYEVSWKAKRLQRDLAALQGLAEQADQLRGQLTTVQERLAATGLR
jgi:Tfp pilus assembly protein PilN